MLASLFTKPNELWFERRDAEKETQVIFWVLSDLLPNRCGTNFSKFGKFSSSSQVGLSVNCFSRCISVSPPPAAAAACWSDQPAESDSDYSSKFGKFLSSTDSSLLCIRSTCLLIRVESQLVNTSPITELCQKEASFQHLWNLSPSCRKYQPSPACQWHWTLNSDTSTRTQHMSERTHVPWTF